LFSAPTILSFIFLFSILRIACNKISKPLPPEKVKIREMILNSDKEYLEINKNDFEQIKLSCDKSKKRIEF
jgi:hypothetical protein